MDYEFKGFKVATSENFSLKVIKPIGKGSVPLPLRGLYTSTAEVEKAIDRFLSEKEKSSAKAAKSG